VTAGQAEDHRQHHQPGDQPARRRERLRPPVGRRRNRVGALGLGHVGLVRRRDALPRPPRAVDLFADRLPLPVQIPLLELVVGERGQAGGPALAVEFAAEAVALLLLLGKPGAGLFDLGVVLRAAGRGDQLVVPGEGGGGAAQPHLDGLGLHLLVAVAQERVEVVADLVVDLVEPLELGGAVKRLPPGGVAGRPLLAGGRLAVDGGGDGLPGVAGGAHLGGDGDQVVEVAAHGVTSGRCADGRGTGSFSPPPRSGEGEKERRIVRFPPLRFGEGGPGGEV
jgi:hypothetical protein